MTFECLITFIAQKLMENDSVEIWSFSDFSSKKIKKSWFLSKFWKMAKFQQELARPILELRQWSSNQKVSTFHELDKSKVFYPLTSFLPPFLVIWVSNKITKIPLFLGIEVLSTKKGGKKLVRWVKKLVIWKIWIFSFLLIKKVL